MDFAGTQRRTGKAGFLDTTKCHDGCKEYENIKSNSFVLVDARSRERFLGKVEEPRVGLKKGCIPGSKNIPFQDCINPEINTFKTKTELINIFKENIREG